MKLHTAFNKPLILIALLIIYGSSFAQYTEGDQKEFWKNDLSIMPPGWVKEYATCAAVGDHSYLFVANDQIEVNFVQEDLDTIMKYLEDITWSSNEKGVFETLIDNFGLFPDAIDNDPKVFVYFTELKSFQGSVIPGYFYIFDQMTEAQAYTYGYHSNECEVVYMNCSPLKPATKYNLSILIRELQQLIHFGLDPDEETWVTEGLSQYAMYTCGINTMHSEFPYYPANSLLNWSKTNADSSKLMLFFTYLSERFGDSEFTKSLVSDTANGIDGINSTFEKLDINIDFPELFSDWTITNFVNNKNFDSGKYAYKNIILPQFAIEKDVPGYPAFETNLLPGCASLYYDLDPDIVNLQINFNFPEASDWITSILAYEGDEIVAIKKYNNNFLSFSTNNEFDPTRLVLIINRTDTGLDPVTFSFTLENITSVEERNNIVIDDLNVNPNPALSNIHLSCNIAQTALVSIKVFDLIGNELIHLHENKPFKGLYSRDVNISDLPVGAYIVHVLAGSTTMKKKFTVIR